MFTAAAVIAAVGFVLTIILSVTKVRKPDNSKLRPTKNASNQDLFVCRNYDLNATLMYFLCTLTN
jgi:hypothetical protein